MNIKQISVAVYRALARHNKLKQDDIDKLSVEKKQSYDARSQKGDIIVVKPDGWKWGKEECPPRFVVIKVPEIKYEDAKKSFQDALKFNPTNYEARQSLRELENKGNVSMNEIFLIKQEFNYRINIHSNKP